MNFLAKKVLEYQKKKLVEAEEKLRYHIRRKENRDSENSKEIESEAKMINIWNNNIEKIKKEIEKIQK